jgi:hypothetical protein
MLIPIGPAEKLPHRELPKRRGTIFICRHEDEVSRPTTWLAIARMDTVAGGPDAVLTNGSCRRDVAPGTLLKALSPPN